MMRQILAVTSISSRRYEDSLMIAGITNPAPGEFIKAP